jgi:hypothetical protein
MGFPLRCRGTETAWFDADARLGRYGVGGATRCHVGLAVFAAVHDLGGSARSHVQQRAETPGLRPLTAQ